MIGLPINKGNCGHILHTAREKDFRKGNFVALKRHGTELYGTLYSNLIMFVAKQTCPDQKKRSDWSKLLHTWIGFSTISALGDTSSINK